MLYLYRRVAFGQVVNDDVKLMPDLSLREFALLAPIAVVVMWMGVYPESFLAPMRKDADILMARIERAQPVGDSRLMMTKGAPAVPAKTAEAE
jgi:NADH-quinone oxidoreductase subunit M